MSACALTAALLAGSIRPGTRLGLGAVLVTGAIWAAAVLALRTRAWGVEQRLMVVLALLLSAAPLVRDADWVTVTDLVGAFCLVAAASVPARSWAPLGHAIAGALGALVPALPALLRPLAPVVSHGRMHGAVPVLRGLGLGAVLLSIFGALFVNADAAFAEVVNRTFVPHWSLGMLPARGAVFAFAGSVGGALALNALTPPPVAGRVNRAAGRLRPAEWVTALVLLDALFAAFVAVQVAVLFGGHDHVLHTAGLTYAEYARQGFGEMTVAAALTLAVAALAARHAARDDLRHERLLQALLGVLFALTLIVLASALRRLGLYEDAFGFTRTRLLAHVAILWIGALLVLVSGWAFLRRTDQLPGAAVLMTGAALTVFTALNPEGIIAARNVERFAATGRLDTDYVRRLSADAVPALTRLPAGVRGCVLGGRGPVSGAGDGWAAANFARARARKLLDRTPASVCTR